MGRTPKQTHGGNMTPKFAWVILVVSLTLGFSATKHNQKTAQASPPAVPSEMKLGLDSVFITMQQNFDEIMASPIVKSKTTASVNGFFFKALKDHQAFYSLTRVNTKGSVINEMIRLVEKPDMKPQDLSKLAWVRRTLTLHKPYSGMVKLEETGRYYLVWAAPIIGKDKNGKETVEGAVSLKIDLWDCFHKYSNSTEIPFLVRLDKLKLYSSKWKNDIRYKEELLTVAGIKKISVRYPKDITPIAAAPVVTEAPVQPPPPVVDSTSIKGTQDSLKVALKTLVKQKQAKKSLINIGIIALLVLILALLFIVIPLIRQRIKMGKIEREDNLL
jgi:hypothetical protein